MPLIKVTYDEDIDSDRFMDRLRVVLPNIVARALTCDHPDGQLTPGDIELELAPFKFGELKMITDYRLHIVIDANDYPQRRANLDERRDQIIRELRETFDDLPKGFVWVRLFPASFGEF